MTSNYGLDADLKRKQEAKYDVGLEKEVTEWIEAVSGEKKGDQVFGDWLKDGKVLCKLANTIKPGSTKKVNESTMPFKQMENITYFMDAARKVGVPETSLFGTPCLYEGKNLGSVINCIYLYGGIIQTNVPEFKGPHLGNAVKAESKDKARDGRVCVDQSQGFSKHCEVERPTDKNNIRGQVSPRPRNDTASTAPSATEEPKPKAEAGEAKPAQAKDRGYSAGPTGVQAPAVAIIPEGDGYAYGLDADLKKKQEEKYDHGLEKEVLQWIEAIGGEQKGSQTLQEWLKDGRILCQLANKVKPGSISKVNTSTLAFKQMENITFFMNAARQMGVPESGMFGTPDLYEDKNMGSVVKCIYMYGGAIQVSMPNFVGPKIGIAAVDNKDAKRQHGICVDSSGGFGKVCEVERPADKRAAYKN